MARFEFWGRFNLAQQFLLATLVVLAANMAAVGWWVAREIEMGIINRTAATTALYAESFIDPLVQDLGWGKPINPASAATLSRLLQDTPLGKEIVSFKVWVDGGTVLYATGPTEVGSVFPVKEELARAWRGEVVARASDLGDAENVQDRELFSRLLEFYVPLRMEGTDRVLAVAEFYQVPEGMEREIANAQRDSWLVVGLATLVTYLLLAGVVRRGSDTIARQQHDLSEKVGELTGLLAQNQDLHERVRRAAARTVALNERFLRRVSSELHDGPVQDLGLALMRLDDVAGQVQPAGANAGDYSDDLEAIRTSLNRAMQEVRGISSGLRLPEVEALSPTEVAARAVRGHERRTSSRVALHLGEGLPERAGLLAKIALYRLLQEALSNAYRHGGGVDQQVRIETSAGRLVVEVRDRGPGFDLSGVPVNGEHLGLQGMRERVESLGGEFRIETGPGKGTVVVATFPAGVGRGVASQEGGAAA